MEHENTPIQTRMLEEEEFVVDKIFYKRIRNGKIEYYVSWKGYGIAENPWEPKENINCPKLIKEFQVDEKLKAKKESEKLDLKSLVNHDSFISFAGGGSDVKSISLENENTQIETRITQKEEEFVVDEIFDKRMRN